MKVRVLDPAEAEIQEAARWYEDRRTGLGLDFVDAVEGALHRIELNPRQFLQIHDRRRELRRVLLRRFSYKVVFEICGDEAVVLAVSHTRRRPYYWRRRRP